jgi:hypothetical protein
MLPKRNSLPTKDTHRLKVNEWKYPHANRNHKWARVAILISNKIDSKPKL